MATTREFIDIGPGVYVVETSLDCEGVITTNKGDERLDLDAEFGVFNGQGEKINLDAYFYEEPEAARSQVAAYVKGLRALAARLRQHAALVEEAAKDA